MKRFARLYTALDQTNRTNEKVAALEAYFREAAPADAAWALAFLCGRRPQRVVSSRAVRDWAAEAAGLPGWLADECYGATGDLAEMVALILPANGSTLDLPLHEVIEQRLLPMRGAKHTGRALLLQTWRELNGVERFVWNKFITGEFRVGVAKTLVVRALASVAGVSQPIMAHRLMGQWRPTPEDFRRIMGGEQGGADELARPYPFFLASPIEGSPAALGSLGDWQIEWKWDGIRAQLIRRQGQALIWSRGDEMVTDAFPEIAEAGHALPDGTVLDGEILAWRGDRPDPFAQLQRRLGRKKADAKLRREAPVVFLAFDLLEWQGEDWRPRPLSERRRQLEKLVEAALAQPPADFNRAGSTAGETGELFEKFARPAETGCLLRLSTLIAPESWEALAALQKESRARQVEGLMLKRRESPYGVGRPRGDWWKWKIDPLVMDAVLIGAQLGHGKRASLYTDYTFGVWHEGKLVPVAKAYSGLTDEEIAEVDKFVRANIAEKFGSMRVVKPHLVFELAFEAIQESTRHKAGLAVRFPRMSRWRHDKKPEAADTLETLRALLKSGGAA